MTISALLLPFLSALGPMNPAAQDASALPDGVFAPANGDLVLVVDPGGESDSMMNLIEEYSRLTNQPVVVDSNSRDHLTSLPAGVQQDVVVPPAGVQSFVEGLLANHGCSLVVRPGDPRSILVTTPRSESRAWAREGALRVNEADLAAWREYPATQIRCTIQLQFEDARQVANSMRTEMTDSNRQLILPISSEGALVVLGGGRWVGNIVGSIRGADEAARAAAQSDFGRVQLAHATALETAALLQELLDAANGSGSGQPQQGPMRSPRVRVVADERTNSVLVMGTGEDLTTARALIAALDVPASAR